MTTFALIHGGAHGGWCWELLVPELEARGHGAVTPDLPFEEDAGAKVWAETVIGALDEAGAGNDVVLVGHSLGGMAVPVIASMRPVRRMVFLGAMVPVPGRVYGDYLAQNPDAVTFTNDFETGEMNSSGLSWEAARDGFYNDVPEDVARRAWDRLRPTALTVFTEQCPIDRWPDVPSTYILMTEDRAVGPEWSRRVARERLGSDAIELPGSHSPFLSRPAVLADVLVTVSQL
jgi:pimeloyl-ACP methyl ester carboxylesterase